MPGPRQGNRRADRDTLTSKPEKRRQPAKQPTKQPAKQPAKQPDRKTASTEQQTPTPEVTGPIDLSSTIPLSLQQLLLDVFKTALLVQSPHFGTDGPAESEPESQNHDQTPLDIKSLIQTIKSHLYQRDFDSAFTDAGEDLLRAYALRWSASRALGYAGLFKGVLGWMRGDGPADDINPLYKLSASSSVRAVCLGGGAGAEIVALAAAWRDLDELDDSLSQRTAEISLEDTQEQETVSKKNLSIAAVDIADWSGVVERLSRTICSPDVPFPSTSRHKSPLIARREDLDVSFSRIDLLGLSESDLKDVVIGGASESALLVTLMFTLNELFSTSMPKTTGFLLRLTEILPRGAVLLVVDSPGSYSSLKIGKGKDEDAQERKYPMKFLLNHALTSVAEGKWERVFTQDSKWWRREAARLRYEVGEGAGLEDMRFQVHIYQRI